MVKYLKIAGIAILALAAIYFFLKPPKIVESTRLQIMTFRDTKESTELKKQLAALKAEKVELQQQVERARTERRDIKEDEQIERTFGPDGKLTGEKITKRRTDATVIDNKSTATTTATSTATTTATETTAENKTRTEKEKTSETLKENKTSGPGGGVFIGAGPYVNIDWRGPSIDYKVANLAAFAGANITDNIFVNLFYIYDPIQANKIGVAIQVRP